MEDNYHLVTRLELFAVSWTWSQREACVEKLIGMFF